MYHGECTDSDKERMIVGKRVADEVRKEDEKE
jgi:hypothetical protein